MSTRVTNRMMSNHAKYHINQNKSYLDKLSVQESSKKKIDNPSDDPVTAIRSLRFRSSLADITQYLDRNLSDAKSWVDSSETALTKARDRLTALKAETTSGASDDKSISDCKTYLDEMKALVDEFYYIGNSTNEDRYLFTGYRTSDSLTISEENLNLRDTQVNAGDPKYDYIIREEFSSDDISGYSFLTKTVSSSDVSIAAGTTTGTPSVDDETDINLTECYRIRLAYDDILSSTSSADLSSTDQLTAMKLELCDTSATDGSYDSTTYTVTAIKDDTEAVDVSGDNIYLNTTTGMLIFGSAVRQKMNEASDHAKSLNRIGIETSGMRFTYEKNNWEAGDLKPEHYFDCVDTALGTGKHLIYNDHEQAMNYSVGANQQIQVNLNASQAFNPQVRRYIDEISDAIAAAESSQVTVDKIESEMEGLDKESAEYKKLDYLLAAANKELSSNTNKMKSLFENGMSEVDGYYNETNLAATEMGTVQNRIDIINSRLTENKTTVQEQASNNENVDIADIAVDIQEANLVYEAALMVTGKINQQSLLNYI